ncbi:amidohydrolase family protein [Neobacillus sp. NRS-1170]|uniref:amidohydrolase family protein n=1 Tax=Neobacillus sp. NRS-1170 TaxID=3233898 RepID=UPI003D2C2014
MKIDAHQHFWELDKPFCEWPTSDLKTIYRDFLPEHFIEHLTRNHVTKTIVVQAAESMEETEFLLGLADQNEFIGGVVGWMDLSSDKFPAQFERLLKHPKFVGLRPMLQNKQNDQWILMPEVLENIQILAENDFPLDLLIYPKHLPYIVELFKKIPTLRAVIDHCAKPAIKDQEWASWADWIKEVSHYQTLMCKLSGLVTEADLQAWQLDEFKPYIHHIIQCFGTDRIMFGSDWPVCLLAAEYDEVVRILDENLPEEMAGEEKELLYGGNAKRFYQLP